jgi:hypothetical protein
MYGRRRLMPLQTRKEELERRLKQSRRLLRGAGDRTTSERISKLIGDLEHEQQLERER